LPVSVNGTGPYEFALDTGCSTTFVSPDFAHELRIVSVPTAGISGAGGKTEAKGGTIESMTIGSAEVRNLHVRVTEAVGDLSQELGRHLHGIVGFNYLRSFHAVIDYPNGILELA